MRFIASNKLISLPAECRQLILLNSLFQGGRLFVAAICVLYFLSFGHKAEAYAWIKTAQSLIFIGLDIPLGYLLNRIGEYKALLVSAAFGVLGALGYLIFTSFYAFLISEISLALSLSTWPIAHSAYAMRILEKYNDNGLIEKYFHLEDAVANVFILICGLVGGTLYALNRHLPYACFLISYFFIILLIFSRLKDCRSIQVNGEKYAFFVCSNFKKLIGFFPIVFVLFLCQFFMQPLFHYWQLFFKTKYTASSIDTSVVFICYSIAMSMISCSYSRMTHSAILRTRLFVLSAAVVASAIYAFIGRLDTFSGSIVVFSISFGIFNLIQVASGVLLQKRLEIENRMIVTKWASFFSRIGMIVSLAVLNCLFRCKWSVVNVYNLYSILAFFVFCLYLFCFLLRKKLGKKYVFDF